jgi:hypothetical protein
MAKFIPGSPSEAAEDTRLRTPPARSYAAPSLLLVLGLLAFYGGTRWLIWLGAGAALVWYGARRAQGGSRNGPAARQ